MCKARCLQTVFHTAWQSSPFTGDERNGKQPEFIRHRAADPTADCETGSIDAPPDGEPDRGRDIAVDAERCSRRCACSYALQPLGAGKVESFGRNRGQQRVQPQFGIDVISNAQIFLNSGRYSNSFRPLIVGQTFCSTKTKNDRCRSADAARYLFDEAFDMDLLRRGGNGGPGKGPDMSLGQQHAEKSHGGQSGRGRPPACKMAPAPDRQPHEHQSDRNDARLKWKSEIGSNSAAM